ncbi:MAG: DNA polymerase III subunit delta' [Pseudomonadota bacterium]
MESVDYSIDVADALDGVLQPFEHGAFFGHNEEIDVFLRAAQSGRMHHAWLLHGPRGVGKATFAFRMARALAERDDARDLTRDAIEQSADENTSRFRKVARGAHPNVLHIKVPFDEKSRKFKTQITVEEVRKCISFFGTTAGNTGWRIAVIDGANDMNRSSANGLLKILEEPPEKTIFFLLSDQPAQLLPTIRSRCQTLAFNPLGLDDLNNALRATTDFDTTQEITDLSQYRDLVGGSVRRAYQFATSGTAELHDTFLSLMNQRPGYDFKQLQTFADAVSGRGSEERFGFFVDFLDLFIAGTVRDQEATGSSTEQLVRWAEVWDKIHDRLRLEQSLNLDRKQTVLASFQDLRAV